MELIKAKRDKAKIKIAIQGCAGSGKTYSSILLAEGLSNGDLSSVAVIDTEGSSNLYADLGAYNVLNIEQPYTPEKYIDAIDLCIKSNMKVILLDSISNCWQYLLGYHAELKGNSFRNWKIINDKHNAFVDKILNSPVHIIATMRTKQAYVLNLKDGKHVPERVGLKAIQRSNIDYEFSIVFDIDLEHNARVTKDRTRLFTNTKKFKINKATGFKIYNWSNCVNEEKLALIRAEITSCETIEGLRHIYSKYQSIKHEIEPYIVAQKQLLDKGVESVKSSLNSTKTSNV